MIVASKAVSHQQHMVETDKARNADEAIIARQSHVLSGNRRKFQGAKVPGPIRSVERKFQGTKRLGSESSRERKGPGAKVPGSELARVLLELSLLGANWPGSEKAVNHAGNA